MGRTRSKGREPESLFPPVDPAKWEGFRQAFHGFDPEWIAALSPPDVDRLAEDARIVRNRRKIEATHNAETMVQLARRHGSFKGYLRSHDGFEETVADLRRQFKFLGDLGAYYFLYVVGENVPPHEEWISTHSRGAARRPARAKR